MLRDLLRGATIPPIVLYDGINGERPQIVASGKHFPQPHATGDALARTQGFAEQSFIKRRKRILHSYSEAIASFKKK